MDYVLFMMLTSLLSIFTIGAVGVSMMGIFMCVGYVIARQRFTFGMFLGIMLMVSIIIFSMSSFYQNVVGLKSIIFT